MRRTLFLVLPVLLALFGTSRAAAGSALSVFPGCFNNGSPGSVICSPYVSGGTGNYVSYYWQVTHSHWGSSSSYRWTSTEPYYQQSCSIGAGVAVTLTVTDSQGETGTGTHSIACSQWAD